MVADDHQTIARRAQHQLADRLLGGVDLALTFFHRDAPDLRLQRGALLLRSELVLRPLEGGAGALQLHLALLIVAQRQRVLVHRRGEPRLVQGGLGAVERKRLLRAEDRVLRDLVRELGGGARRGQLLVGQIRREVRVVELGDGIARLDHGAVAGEPAQRDVPLRHARHDEARRQQIHRVSEAARLFTTVEKQAFGSSLNLDRRRQNTCPAAPFSKTGSNIKMLLGDRFQQNPF